MSVKSSLMGDIVATLLFASIIPSILFALYYYDIIVLATLKLSLAIFFIVFFIGPLIFKYCYSLQQQVIFLNYVNWPKNPDYNTPEKYGLNATKNFYVKTIDGVNLGVWHVLPNSLAYEGISKDNYEHSLSRGPPVFIYMHGNSGNRAAGHRIDLYKVLRKYYHVIAFDYRSYGDSTAISPTEMGCITDAKTMIRWVKNLTDVKTFVWGHSLGTGISTHALRLLEAENIRVDGLVLESPFNSIRNEVGEHPSAMLFKNLPWFQYTVVEALYNSGFRFESDKHITHVNCPILILHAEDDLVVPFRLGYQLYETALKNRTREQGKVQFERFLSKYGYGHKYICNATNLPSIISNFVEESEKRY